MATVGSLTKGDVFTNLQPQSYEVEVEKIAKQAAKDLNTPKFTDELLESLNSANQKQLDNLCELFKKYLPKYCSVSARLSVFVDLLKEKNDASYARLRQTTIPINKDILAADSDKYIVEFWGLVATAYKATTFAQSFLKQVNQLEPGVIIFSGIEVEFAKLAKRETTEEIEGYIKESRNLETIRASRYEVANVLYSEVAATAGSIERNLPILFRRLGLFEQTVSNDGIPYRFLPYTLSKYSIRLPSSNSSSSSTSSNSSSSSKSGSSSSTSSNSSSSSKSGSNSAQQEKIDNKRKGN